MHHTGIFITIPFRMKQSFLASLTIKKVHMKKVLILLAVIASATYRIAAQNGGHQPYANYWFPSTLLTWTPAGDTASPFNRGRVPLASRFIDTLSSPCPVSKSPDVKLSCLSVTNSTTSFNPSQGYDHAGEYDFGFWQYTNYFVMWGGSAGEGLILAPNPTWIDAGHRNGVKVMGTIFFPPTVYGGNIQWVNDLTQNTGGVYPVADKLIEMANYYGFDGFFINQETGGGSSSTGTAMEGFMAYFQQHCGPNMEIMWYDAMLPSGAISYQNALNTNDAPMFQNGSTLESNAIFLNYNWSSGILTSSANEANTLGRSPYDVHAGIDVSSNGYNTGVNWNAIFPAVNRPKVSVGLFCPSWTFHSSPDKNNVPLFYQREEAFWVGANNSPCNVPASGWPGLSKYYIEKSVINSWPFITNFNTGQGTNGFWINGTLLSTKPWHNLSTQDILPTWRWASQSSGTPLSVGWDFTTAYNGGNSLLINGSLGSSSTTTVKLYNTKLPVTASSNLSITYKMDSAAPTDMQVAVAFTNAPGTFYYLPCGAYTGGGWQTKSLSLGSYAGDTLCVAGLQFASATTISNYAINIGQIALTNTTAPAPPAVSNLHLTTYMDCANAEVEIFFDTLAASNNIWYYDFYRTKPDGVQQWIGRSPNNAYYVKNISRIDNEASTQIVVIAVNAGGVAGPQATATFTWPANATNSAISLNGNNKYLSSGIVNLSGNALTIEGWVNANSFKSASPNISAMVGINDTNQNVALLSIGNTSVGNNKAQFSLNVGGTIMTLTAAATLNTGTWYHLAGTYDGSQMTLYINGVRDTMMAASGTVRANGHFYIGYDSSASVTSYLDGMLDEVRAWTVARSPAEITGSRCAVSDTTTGLAAYWDFNDCSNGAIAYDKSGNIHDATALHMTSADWIASTLTCLPNGIQNIAATTPGIRLYPNPLGTGQTLTLEIPAAAPAVYTIYDGTGRQIARQPCTQQITSISTQGYSPGVYLCHVSGSYGTYTASFVIE